MMVRTQISLPEGEHRRARAKAAALGVSLAEYVRRLVRDDLGEEAPPGDISVIFGLGASGGPGDVAENHDKYVGEAVWEDYVRGTRES